MIYVEDLLRGLGILVAAGTITDSWRTNFINNVTFHVNSGYGLSTSQSRIILKTAENYVSSVASALRVKRDDVKYAIDQPSYRKAPYQSTNVPREVRYIGMNKLAFRFKRDPVVTSDLKALSVRQQYVDEKVMWHTEYKIWMVPVTNENLDGIMDVIKRHKFNPDSAVIEYLTLCTNSRKVTSTFVLDEAEETLYINICNNPLLAHVVSNLLKAEAV
jgi:hypothetical protein